MDYLEPYELAALVSDPMTNEDRLLANREIILHGEIEDAMASAVVMKLLYLQDLDRRAPITLHIESPGGLVAAGFAIVDTIDMITPPVHTCCHRFAEAMAAVIAAHGAKGRRLAGQGSRLSLSATYVEFGHTVAHAEIDRIDADLIQVVAKDTGRSLEEAALAIKSGFQFSARQAKEFGLIDAMVCCRRSLPEGTDLPAPKFLMGQKVRVIINERNRTPYSGYYPRNHMALQGSAVQLLHRGERQKGGQTIPGLRS